MTPRVDLTGRRIGRLRVLRYNGYRKRFHFWLTRCDCGVEKSFRHDVLVSRNHRNSCGCLWIERVVAANTKHGKCKTPEYTAWCLMISRCTNNKKAEWHRYGGRGIRVCRRWRHSFQSFLDDMGQRPSPRHSLDRVKNNGDYKPSNCRWATKIEQSRNTEVYLDAKWRRRLLRDMQDELQTSRWPSASIERWLSKQAAKIPTRVFSNGCLSRAGMTR